MGQIVNVLAVDESYKPRINSKFGFYCGVALNGDPTELVKSEYKLAKPLGRGERRKVMAKLNDHPHSFLMWNLEKLHSVKDYKRWGYILAALLDGEQVGDPLSLYIDGGVRKRARRFTKEAVSKQTGIPTRHILIYYGQGLDERVPLVNLAHKASNILCHRLESINLHDSKRKGISIEQIASNLKL